MADYSVSIKNNSLANGKMCIFQKLPNQKAEIFSLAWLSKQCNKNSKIVFNWGIEYCATWAETGTLQPGVTFTASETADVDPSNPAKNAMGFTYIDGGYSFTKTTKKADDGTIGIFPDNKIPNLQASIGVGMNGESAFATQALMNFNFIFIPKVRYYLVFGSYEQGVVMDLSSSTDAFEITFPTNVFKREIELGQDNQFVYTK